MARLDSTPKNNFFSNPNPHPNLNPRLPQPQPISAILPRQAVAIVPSLPTPPPVPTPCRKVSSSRQFAIATHPISPPEPHLSRPSKAPPRIAYGDRCPRPVHQGELVRRLNEEEALTILRPSMGHPAVPRNSRFEKLAM
uniref:Uncharacterized protein n=1 Tax=Oryza barthii TaxID=65489 RepID=A0A0D3EKV4_9ORYZ